MPGIRVAFFEAAEASVFQACLSKYFSGGGDVVVKPLERFGYSGAKVFVFHPDGEESSLPYVGKLHSIKGIEEEIEARKRAKNVFSDAQRQAYHCSDDKSDKAILATPLIADHPGPSTSVKELKDFLFKGEGPHHQKMQNVNVKVPIPSDTQLVKMITDMYKDLFSVAFRSCRTVRCCLGEQYQWYLRKHASKPLFTDFLGKNSGKKLVEILDSSYPNPLVLVERLVRQSRDLSVATVHGDLHPSNVVYDFRKTPHLIDFSWCRQNAHILQDFLVMECSVRFLMSSRGLSPKQQSATDSALLARTVDPDSIAGRLEKSGVPKPTRDRVARSTKIVNCLRDQAAKACGEGFTISDYLACQALVLYGLCRVKEYPFLTCINALGLIGRQLDKIGYVQ